MVEAGERQTQLIKEACQRVFGEGKRAKDIDGK